MRDPIETLRRAETLAAYLMLSGSIGGLHGGIASSQGKNHKARSEKKAKRKITQRSRRKNRGK